MESGEVKAEQRQQPVRPKKRRRPKPNKSAQANGGSSSSAAESSSLSRTSSSPPSDDADGKGQQQQQHHQQDGGKRPRLVWTTELHNLFAKAYDSLGKEAVPRRILEKMNEKMNLPEVTRENIASHLQKYKLYLRSKGAEGPLGVEASTHSHSPTEEAAADSHSLHSLPLAAEVPSQTPPDCLSRSSSSIAKNLHNLQSIQQQQLCGCGPPTPIKEGQAAQQPAQTMQRAPADVEGHGWSLEQNHCTEQRMETLTAVLFREANTKAVIRMAQAAKAENAAEAEAAPAPAPAPAGILAQFWASPDHEACTSSWDIFGLSRGT